MSNSENVTSNTVASNGESYRAGRRFCSKEDAKFETKGLFRTQDFVSHMQSSGMEKGFSRS